MVPRLFNSVVFIDSFVFSFMILEYWWLGVGYFVVLFTLYIVVLISFAFWLWVLVGCWCKMVLVVTFSWWLIYGC